jgi:hypothetical protein
MKKSGKFLRLLKRYKCGLRAYITLKGDVTIRTHDNFPIACVNRDGETGSLAVIGDGGRKSALCLYVSPDESPRDCWRHVVSRVRALIPENILKPDYGYKFEDAGS